MAWQDPLEIRTEEFVDNLSEYLKDNVGLNATEIARIQEVCRDFGKFIDKDIHQASHQDFMMYLQLHASTSENEAEYKKMLTHIRAFSQLGGVSEKDQPKPGAKRKSAKTCHFEPSMDMLKELFADPNSTMVPNALDNASDKTPMPNDDLFNHLISENISDNPFKQDKALDITAEPFAKSNKAQDITADPFANLNKALKDIEDPFATQDKSQDVPNDLFADLDKALENQAAILAPKDKSQDVTVPPHQSISESFDQFNFSIDDNLASEIASQQESPESKENIEAPPAHDPAPVQPKRSDSVADEFSVSSPKQNKAIPHNNELLRGVDNINYDFAKIQKVREVNTTTIAQYAQNPDVQHASGFRKWVYNNKYEIDRPLPDPQKIVPCQSNQITRYLYPLLPFILFFVLTISLGQFIYITAVIFGILAFISLIIAIPELKPTAQQTVQATLHSYYNARSGYCLSIGNALIATEDKGAEPDLADIWKDYKRMPAMIINRFKKVTIPEYTIINGSDKQNCVLVLITQDDAYYIVPMARTNDRWFITDPTLGKHTLSH